MATSAKFTNDFLENIDDQQLEIFCIIWLDDNNEASDNRNTEQQLRSIINRLKRFKNVGQCEKYINERSPDDRLILIVSGRLGRQIVPRIYTVRQVISIYVYCMDEASNKEWSKKYTKVKAVVTELEKLVFRIKTDHKIQQIIEQPLSINIFTSGNSTGGVNGKFVFSQVLIDCLLRLKSSKADTDELIQHCKKVYQGNRFELSNLNEFQKQYSSDKAVWWYTRDTFFFKTLNAVLRAENIHMIYLFRSYIADIQQQLKMHQVKGYVCVYRGQLMAKTELENLQKSCGQFISINSFFSTSTENKQALVFLNVPDIPDNLERVLFEIYADSKAAATKPFANISSLSEYADESEILFMIGSIFRLNGITRSNDGQLSTIRMTLYSENDSELRNVLTHMKQQLGAGETNLRILGKVLWKMGRLDLAEFYLTRLLNDLPPQHHLLGDLYVDLSEIAGQMQDYDKSVAYKQKALECKGSSDWSDKLYSGEDRKQKTKETELRLKSAASSSSHYVHEKTHMSHAKTSKATITNVQEMPQNQSNVPETTWPIFSELNLQIVSHQNANVIKIDNGATHTEILVRTPSNVVLMGRLKDSNDEKIFGGDRVFFDRRRKLWRCLFAPNWNGTFEALILAKRRSDAGSYTSACRYTIEARQIPSIPFSFPKTWQLFHDLDLEVETPYDRSTITWPKNTSYVEIRMRVPDDVYLSCSIKYNDNKIDNGTLTQFDSDNNNWQLLFAPQRTGLHILSVYAKRENDGESTSSSVVQFQLNVTQLKQSMKFPIIYKKFHTNKCRILEPLHGTLKKGSVVLIHCIIPGAIKLDVQTDSTWNKSEGYHDPVFKTKVTVGSEDVGVYAKYGHKDSYDGLFKYTVQ